MITFTATTLLGVQLPQLKHSGAPQEGPCLIKRQEALQKQLQEQTCEKHSPGSLHQPLSSWKRMPLHDPVLHAHNPQWISPTVISLTPAPFLTPEMRPTRSPLTFAPECHCWFLLQSWTSPSCCLQGLGGTLDTAFGIPQDGHQGRCSNCREKIRQHKRKFHQGV